MVKRCFAKPRPSPRSKISRMVKFWFVRCKTCQTPLADEDSTFVSDPKDPQCQSPVMEDVIKSPECHNTHEYTWTDLEATGVE